MGWGCSGLFDGGDRMPARLSLFDSSAQTGAARRHRVFGLAPDLIRPDRYAYARCSGPARTP
jgi:hypothetical protein